MASSKDEPHGSPPDPDRPRPDDLPALAQSLYAELRAAARAQLAGERAGHTLQPTALVHEAWLRIGPARSEYASKEQFVAVAVTSIRHVLIDHARRKQAARRGGDAARVDFDLDAVGDAVPVDDVLTLHDALERLAAFAPEQARVVELRFFGGLSQPEMGRVLGVSESTIERRWRLARAWLRTELEVDGR